ncbi:hypothetical protein ACP8HZ_01055 [Francisella noatunensis]
MLDSTEAIQSRRTSNNHKLSCKVKNLIIALLKKRSISGTACW